MKKCNRCNINFETDRLSCPFCRDVLVDDNNPNFQSYPKFEEAKNKKRLVEKIFIFLSIIAVVICAIANYYDYMAGNTYLWSVVVLIGIILLWVFVRGIIISNRYFAQRLLFVVLLLELMFISIELINIKYLKLDWSITYMLPFLTIAYLGTLSMYALIKPKRYVDFFIYLLVISFVSISEILLVVLNKTSADWPIISSSLFSLFVFIGLFLFPTKTTKEEFKKRFRV